MYWYVQYINISVVWCSLIQTSPQMVWKFECHLMPLVWAKTIKIQIEICGHLIWKSSYLPKYIVIPTKWCTIKSYYINSMERWRKTNCMHVIFQNFAVKSFILGSIRFMYNSKSIYLYYNTSKFKWHQWLQVSIWTGLVECASTQSFCPIPVNLLTKGTLFI